MSTEPKVIIVRRGGQTHVTATLPGRVTGPDALWRAVVAVTDEARRQEASEAAAVADLEQRLGVA